MCQNPFIPHKFLIDFINGINLDEKNYKDKILILFYLTSLHVLLRGKSNIGNILTIVSMK